jgi:MIP family channel proteins
MYRLPQRLFAEWIGTFVVVFTAAGAVCASQAYRATHGPGEGLLPLALAYGLAMAAMVIALGHVSGGHFNPAVTAGFWVTRRISTPEFALYAIAQLAGAVAAAYLLRWAVPQAIWRPVALGTPDLATDLTRARGMVFEGAATFFLVLVECAAVGARGPLEKLAGVAVGLTVTMGVLFAGPLTGGALNPARAFGPALASHHWLNHGVYWVGPLAGGVVAGWVFDAVVRGKPKAGAG